jgi:hypothetical protein
VRELRVERVEVAGRAGSAGGEAGARGVGAARDGLTSAGSEDQGRVTGDGAGAAGAAC